MDLEKNRLHRTFFEKSSDLFFEQFHLFKFGLDKSSTVDLKKAALRKNSSVYIDHATGERKIYKTKELPEKKDGTVRIVIVSDIHSTTNTLNDTNVPVGDILIVAGDMTMTSGRFSNGYNYKQYAIFNRWLAGQPHSTKFVIGGNHDDFLEKLGKTETQELLSAGTYLEDSAATAFGLRFWGSPVSYGRSWNRAFQNNHSERLEKMQGCDVLITHGPAEQDEELEQKVKELAPRLHVSGHLHWLYGSSLVEGTLSVNGSALNGQYRPENLLQVTDVAIP